jgi:hypothetical protein
MNGKAVVFGIILLLVGLGGGYYFATHYTVTPQPKADQPLVGTPTQTLVGGDRDAHGCILSAGYSWCDIKQKCLRTWEEPCAPITPADETAAVSAAVKTGLIAEHGPDAGNMTITVTKIEGDFAQGGAGGSGGGGMWFAAKVNGSWKLVWDGNGTISCVPINLYNFPNTLVPECYDEATQKSVTR